MYLLLDASNNVVGVCGIQQNPPLPVGVTQIQVADTDPRIATYNTTNDPTTTTNLRSAATAILTDPNPSPKVLRAILLALLQRLNTLAANHDALLTYLGGQTTLTNRTQLTGMTDGQVTTQQALSAVQSEITSGAAD